MYFFGGAASPALTMPTPRAEIVAALAGPLVSLALGIALVVAAVLAMAVGGDVARVVSETCLVVGVLNLVLGGVNLLPAFPLDGGRVSRAVAWHRSGDPIRGLRSSARVGRWLGIGLTILGIGMILTMDSIDGLMLALCGWFLVSSARAIGRSAAVDDLLRDLRVGRRHGSRRGRRAPGDDPRRLRRADPGHAGRLRAGARRVRARRRARARATSPGCGHPRGPTTRAGDLMTGTSDLPPIDPTTPVQAARDQLQKTGLDGLPVLEAGRLAGIVTRRAIAKAIRDQDGAPAAGTAT